MTFLGLNISPGGLKNVLVLPNSAEFFVGRSTQKNVYRKDSDVLSFGFTENKSQWKTTKIHLKANSLFRIDGDGRETVVTCVTGTLWVTQEGGTSDHILKSGEEFVITKKGIVLLQTLTDVMINIKSKSYVKNDKD